MDANAGRKRQQDRHDVSFNPRARDGRELATDGVLMFDHVSIHAPVMDANPSR